MASIMRWLALAALPLLLGCKDDHAAPHASSEAHPTASPTAVSTAPTGIADCDAYLGAAHRCLVADAGGDDLGASVAQYRRQAAEATTEAARQSLAIGCRVALEALRDEPGCPP